jgi:hypothetical protein
VALSGCKQLAIPGAPGGKVNLDLFWLKTTRWKNRQNLPDPTVSAREIVDDLESVLAQFVAIGKISDGRLSQPVGPDGVRYFETDGTN